MQLLSYSFLILVTCCLTIKVLVLRGLRKCLCLVLSNLGSALSGSSCAVCYLDLSSCRLGRASRVCFIEYINSLTSTTLEACCTAGLETGYREAAAGLFAFSILDRMMLFV